MIPRTQARGQCALSFAGAECRQHGPKGTKGTLACAGRLEVYRGMCQTKALKCFKLPLPAMPDSTGCFRIPCCFPREVCTAAAKSFTKWPRLKCFQRLARLMQRFLLLSCASGAFMACCGKFFSGNVEVGCEAKSQGGPPANQSNFGLTGPTESRDQLWRPTFSVSSWHCSPFPQSQRNAAGCSCRSRTQFACCYSTGPIPL